MGSGGGNAEGASGPLERAYPTDEASSSVGDDWPSSAFHLRSPVATAPRSVLRQSSSGTCASSSGHSPLSSSCLPSRSGGVRSASASSYSSPTSAETAPCHSGSCRVWMPSGILRGIFLNLRQKLSGVWRVSPAADDTGGCGGRGAVHGTRRVWMKGLLGGIALAALLFLLANWWMLSVLLGFSLRQKGAGVVIYSDVTSPPRFVFRSSTKIGKGKRFHGILHSKLLALAAHALAEGDSKPETRELWQERNNPGSLWKPCAEQGQLHTYEESNGYILISANGGISQQRIAICNAVAIARLLNSTLVLPKFLYSNVWKDTSQFSDIYQEDYFIDYLKADVRIVKELPVELQSLDLEAIGSLVTDSEVMKESKPSFYLKKILPILIRNRVVHFIGFGNRLAFDPIPFELQRLRCRCNFHALQFVRKIQEAGALLIQRMRINATVRRALDDNLVGPFSTDLAAKSNGGHFSQHSRYLAVHLRFEIDMVAYSMCYFGGGREEEQELETYRKDHFPVFTQLKDTTRIPSPAQLRSEGQCPLTPEEAVLMLAALGFKRKTRLYIAGANVYGGQARMAALVSLYPNLVTKESLLTSSEIEPFTNFSSQLAALDFIVCAAADSFAMTDSGSQFSSIVSGYRMYYGGGVLSTIRPNKRRLASVFLRSSIEWRSFEHSVKKALRQTKRTIERPIARSIYRHPRCVECMCKSG